MSGHSKFANIKHTKEKNDAAKGKIFTIIGREIAVAVKEGGPDPNNNFKLAAVIAKAKANNMPNDTINNGIKKAAGDTNSVDYKNFTYEGYGPNGIAIIVETLTDNANRTAANVRSAFTKGNGSIGAQGCVSFMFDRKGQIIIDREECDTDPDELMIEVARINRENPDEKLMRMVAKQMAAHKGVKYGAGARVPENGGGTVFREMALFCHFYVPPYG